MERVSFTSLEGVTKWLVSTKTGRAALRDAVYSSAEIQNDLNDRQIQPAYVLVKAWGDGRIEVFAERHVRVQIVGLPATDDQETERLAEEWVDFNLKPNFAAVNWPSWKRATEYIPPYWSVREFIESTWWKEHGQKMLKEIDETCRALLEQTR